MFCNGCCCFCPVPCTKQIRIEPVKKPEPKKEEVTEPSTELTVSDVQSYEVKSRFGKLIARKTK